MNSRLCTSSVGRVVELVVQALREARREQRLAAVVEDVEAGAGLLVVGREQPMSASSSIFGDMRACDAIT
jgi:hypothetical protein